MARKGQFKKGGGRVGGSTTTVSRSRKRGGGGGALVVVTPPARPARRHYSHGHAKHHKKSRRRHASPGGGITMGKVIVTGLALSSAETNSGPLGATVYDLVQKIPGAKTFGGAATLGLVAGGLHQFTRFGGSMRPWMRTAGLIGVGLAALKIGIQGSGFKWLGDSMNDRVMDVE